MKISLKWLKGIKDDNLSFGDYNKVGDHWEFLFHFLVKSGTIIQSGVTQNLFSDTAVKTLVL